MRRILDSRTAWREHERAATSVLVDARDYYLAFYEAARRARRSILLLGWQFDSDVQLLRGADLPAGSAPEETELLALLDRLCRARPELEVRILAWDHSVFFALEREMLQKLVFDTITNERFFFRWDDTVALGASHHQKLAIIDGRIAFTGSADICQSRWDTSGHEAVDARRVARNGVPYKPYHEVQVALAGPVVRILLELFVERWKVATGEELDPAALVHPSASTTDAVDVPSTLPMPVGKVALSRTLPAAPGRAPACEIRELHLRAVREAERFVYAETQYFTSTAVRDALLARMDDRSRPPLELVFVLPRKPERFKEEFAVGYPQAELIDVLTTAARRRGHQLGIYNVAAAPDVHVYVHSKLLIVDDRFMTVGSANLTNRSMAADTELNVSWEAGARDGALRAAIRRARTRLLAEHVGAPAGASRAELAEPAGLVARLDALIAAGRGRLCHHDREVEAPSVISRVVQELACEYLDPRDARAVSETFDEPEGRGPRPLRPSAA